MIRTIAFDWDGVIVDSMPFIARGIQETAASYGVEKTLEEIENGFFQPRKAYYSSIGIDTADQEELNRRHFGFIDKYRRPAPLFPEVAEVLWFLKENKITLAVVSTGKTAQLLEQITRFDLGDIFREDLVLGGEMAKSEKLSGLLNTLGASQGETLYVGDLSSDITAARTAGILAAGIDRKESGRKHLAIFNPDHLFSSLDDLKPLIEKQL